MEQYERDFYVSRIVTGYLKYKKGSLVLKILPPSKDVEFEANELFIDAYQEALDDDIFDSDSIIKYMIDCGIWTESQEKEFQKLPGVIDNLKVGLFETTFKSLERDKIRKFLKETKTEYERLSAIRNSWRHLTAEGVASLIKQQFIIEHSTYTLDGNNYDWTDLNTDFMLAYTHSQRLGESQIRELARNEPWATIWAVKKLGGAVFKDPLSVEQQMLVVWSIIYDRIGESPDRPAHSVLEDDDMLDGWFIVQKRKTEGEENKSRAEKILSNPNLAKANEIFIPAETIHDVKQIEAMNDVHASVVRQQRFNKLSKEERVPYAAFKDVNDQLKMEVAQRERNRK